jgi:hypothetical protein
VWSAPRLSHFTAKKDPVPIVQEAEWAPGLVWTCVKKSCPHWDSIPGPSSPSVTIPTELPGPHVAGGNEEFFVPARLWRWNRVFWNVGVYINLRCRWNPRKKVYIISRLWLLTDPVFIWNALCLMFVVELSRWRYEGAYNIPMHLFCLFYW